MGGLDGTWSEIIGKEKTFMGEIGNGQLVWNDEFVRPITIVQKRPYLIIEIEIFNEICRAKVEYCCVTGKPIRLKWRDGEVWVKHTQSPRENSPWRGGSHEEEKEKGSEAIKRKRK